MKEREQKSLKESCQNSSARHRMWEGSLVLLSEEDLWHFNEGTHCRLYEKLGAHPENHHGTHFRVWAPNALQVHVIGSFNDWDPARDALAPVSTSGIWKGFVPEAQRGDIYKYRIVSRYGDRELEKADPFAVFAETPPKTGSIIWDLDYTWSDNEWMAKRAGRRLLNSPVSIYEVHLQSWRLNPEEGNRLLTYRELAVELADYVSEMGFTHVELMPVMEHPRADSWGYKTTGYFAASSRFGTPQDLMFLVEYLHRHDIGVILDWSPAHFACDQHGLCLFDGTHLYDHQDDRQGQSPEWGTRIFNYGRNEVRSFLCSSAFLWLDKYHVDGLRVDAVTSMLYRDYSRGFGEWIPNEDGSRENWPAVSFLRQLNDQIHQSFPSAETFAEESTAWPMVTRPASEGGLGFGFKWDMGWMNDMLAYMSEDPIYRKHHHDKLTFRILYVWHENFLMPLSHDEVACGEGSMLNKMPGTDWEKFANLRLLYGSMYAHPGKKLLFMGCEFGQWEEWSYNESIKWHQLEHPPHAGMARWVIDLNRFYRAEPALHETDCEPVGFQWLDCKDAKNSVVSFVRQSRTTGEMVLGVFNFTPVVRHQYWIGVPRAGFWREVLNSDAEHYWGSDCGNGGGVHTRNEQCHEQPCSITITLPPLAAVIFKHEP